MRMHSSRQQHKLHYITLAKSGACLGSPFPLFEQFQWPLPYFNSQQAISTPVHPPPLSPSLGRVAPLASALHFHVRRVGAVEEAHHFGVTVQLPFIVRRKIYNERYMINVHNLYERKDIGE